MIFMSPDWEGGGGREGQSDGGTDIEGRREEKGRREREEG